MNRILFKCIYWSLKMAHVSRIAAASSLGKIKNKKMTWTCDQRSFSSVNLKLSGRKIKHITPSASGHWNEDINITPCEITFRTMEIKFAKSHICVHDFILFPSCRLLLVLLAWAIFMDQCLQLNKTTFYCRRSLCRSQHGRVHLCVVRFSVSVERSYSRYTMATQKILNEVAAISCILAYVNKLSNILLPT